MLRVHFRPRRPVNQPSEGVGDWLQLAQKSAASCCAETLVVDLTAVEAVNSRELDEIARLQLSLRERGKQLVLENARRAVVDVFEMTRMNRLVEVHLARDIQVHS